MVYNYFQEIIRGDDDIMDTKIQELIKKLESKNIKTKYFATKEEVKADILREVGPNMVIGIGGSMTIMELGIYQELKAKDQTVYWHWMAKPEERDEIRRRASFTSDLYLTSTNAITEQGELINIDGVGNRVSAMYFGPKKVIVICGKNKICKNYPSAISRIKTIACPQNAKRLGLQTPCAMEGRCKDCSSPDRMCNITTIINHKPSKIDFNVYVVDEELGF